MAAPKKRTGTVSPRGVAPGDGGGGGGGGRGGGGKKRNQGGRPDANSKGNGVKKGGKKGKKGKSISYNMTPLNPPFDPRMRQIGSPLNAGSGMKRGWVQTEEDDLRVNFLFNPSQLDISHTPIESVRTADQAQTDDPLGISYASMGSSTGVKLLYDRTYELFGPSSAGSKGFANRFGVYADVAAWYVLLGMLPEMPTSWESSIITDPPQPKLAYLFVGPRMVYYGRIAGASVTYSHWTQNMIPARCAVDVSFEILPLTTSAPLRGRVDLEGTGGGWRGDWELNSGMDYLP